MKEVLPVLIIVLSSLLQLTSQQEAADEPLVTLSIGKIKGGIIKSQKRNDIFAFRGIRYAEPPVDELRFKPPVPKKPWNDTLSATRDSLVCPQPGVTTFMSEDCLSINVFSRNLTGRIPVMVYIHGGAYVLGSGHSLYEAGPQYLLDYNVVLVAFNYRLGALGFLSTGTAEAPGNYGFLDQVLALKWVQDHISNFGGDPGQVTIFGLSAGSMAVSLHLASPLSRGLFHKAIAMSGAATHHYAIDNQYWTRKLAREVSCPMYSPKNLVDCLRTVSWKTIVSVCSQWEPYKMTNMKWNYEIDNNFLDYHPTDYFYSNNFTKVPIIIGLTLHELDYSVYHQENNTALLDDISSNFDLYAPEFYLYNSSYESSRSISSRLWSHYLGEDQRITKANLEKFGKIFSDGILGHGIHRLLNGIRPHQEVYFYVMSYIGRRSLYNDEFGNPRGVGHADDIQYIMPGLWYGPQFREEDPEMEMVDRMSNLWTSFAKTGVPKLDDGSINWEPTTKDKVKAFFIDKEPYMDDPPYSKDYQLWDELFPRNSAPSALSSLFQWTLIVYSIITIKIFI